MPRDWNSQFASLSLSRPGKIDVRAIENSSNVCKLCTAVAIRRRPRHVPIDFHSANAKHVFVQICPWPRSIVEPRSHIPSRGAKKVRNDDGGSVADRPAHPPSSSSISVRKNSGRTAMFAWLLSSCSTTVLRRVEVSLSFTVYSASVTATRTNNYVSHSLGIELSSRFVIQRMRSSFLNALL